MRNDLDLVRRHPIDGLQQLTPFSALTTILERNIAESFEQPRCAAIGLRQNRMKCRYDRHGQKAGEQGHNMPAAGTRRRKYRTRVGKGRPHRIGLTCEKSAART